ncbi:hypothetical protein CC2G_009691 [Coprinopsis cinerea AmutBmut pab1-1]|nr:hypothetical protein CC2G_009691 [Coprinopsis cinerea AmutBmut pab1-1]
MFPGLAAAEFDTGLRKLMAPTRHSHSGALPALPTSSEHICPSLFALIACFDLFFTDLLVASPVLYGSTRRCL